MGRWEDGGTKHWCVICDSAETYLPYLLPFILCSIYVTPRWLVHIAACGCLVYSLIHIVYKIKGCSSLSLLWVVVFTSSPQLFWLFFFFLSIQPCWYLSDTAQCVVLYISIAVFCKPVILAIVGYTFLPNNPLLCNSLRVRIMGGRQTRTLLHTYVHYGLATSGLQLFWWQRFINQFLILFVSLIL